jgi:transposase InsO family protein
MHLRIGEGFVVSVRCLKELIERLAAAGLEPSGCNRGDAYDHALAETEFGRFKTEVIRRQGPWRNLDDVEYATLEWVAWYNSQRLLGPLGYLPPAEYEAHYVSAQTTPVAVGVLN